MLWSECTEIDIIPIQLKRLDWIGFSPHPLLLKNWNSWALIQTGGSMLFTERTRDLAEHSAAVVLPSVTTFKIKPLSGRNIAYTFMVRQGLKYSPCFCNVLASWYNPRQKDFQHVEELSESGEDENPIWLNSLIVPSLIRWWFVDVSQLTFHMFCW